MKKTWAPLAQSSQTSHTIYRQGECDEKVSKEGERPGGEGKRGGEHEAALLTETERIGNTSGREGNEKCLRTAWW